MAGKEADFRDVDEVTKTAKGVTFSLPLETRKRINELRRELKLDKPAHVVRKAIDAFRSSENEEAPLFIPDVIASDFSKEIDASSFLDMAISDVELFLRIHYHFNALAHRIESGKHTRLMFDESDRYRNKSTIDNFIASLDKVALSRLQDDALSKLKILPFQVKTFMVLTDSYVWLQIHTVFNETNSAFRFKRKASDNAWAASNASFFNALMHAEAMSSNLIPFAAHQKSTTTLQDLEAIMRKHGTKVDPKRPRKP